MKLRNLFTDDRAVSPVIGVILMVAITVILAAVIGTFVLGLGDSVQQTTPNANFASDQGTETVNESSVTSLTVTHEGGDSIAENNLEVTVAGSEAFGVNPDDESAVLWDTDGDVTAGSSVTVVAFAATDGAEGAMAYETDENGEFENDEFTALSSGDNVRVVWSSDDGSSSATLFNRQVN